MDAQERDRKLRLVESAAASAVLNGCHPDDVRRVVEDGIAEGLDLNARSSAAPETAPAQRDSHLGQWARMVDAA